MKTRLQVVLGRDMRTSSPTLFEVAKKTLISLGATTINIGLSSTPTFYFAVLKYGFDAGIQISASHNPPQYNGIKFVRRDDQKLVKIGKNTGMADVRDTVIKGDFLTASNDGSMISKNDTLKEEVDFALQTLPDRIKPLKVVADPANAMGILYLEELFRRLPCSLVKMNFNLDGTFPAHQPDPLEAKNVKELEKKVLEEKADIGIAPDGDGDRVFFVDETGHIVPASLITSLLIRDLLNEFPGEKILIDIRYTKNIENTVKKYKGIPLIGKVGHALITEHMIKEDVFFSGESSGHYFYRTTGYAENSVLTILRLLNILSKSGKPLSALAKEVQSSYESGEFNFVLADSADAKGLLATFSECYSTGKASTIDGLAIDFPEWRFSVRTSNTEPLLRLNVEGSNEKIVQAKLKELRTKIIASGAKPKL